MNPFEQLVRERAYDIWESEGRVFGRAEDHWLTAEAELRAASLSAPVYVQPVTADLSLAPSPAKTLKPRASRSTAAKAVAEKAVVQASRDRAAPDQDGQRQIVFGQGCFCQNTGRAQGGPRPPRPKLPRRRLHRAPRRRNRSAPRSRAPWRRWNPPRPCIDGKRIRSSPPPLAGRRASFLYLVIQAARRRLLQHKSAAATMVRASRTTLNTATAGQAWAVQNHPPAKPRQLEPR